MTVETSLALLMKRKTTVKEGMSYSRTMINTAKEKIRRLEGALHKMEASIDSLRNVKNKVKNYEVTKAKWEGNREKEFEGKYHSYHIYVSKYYSETDEAKALIEEVLATAREERDHAQIGLGNLQAVLNGLERDIALARARSRG